MKMKILLTTLLLMLPSVVWGVGTDGKELGGASVTRGSYDAAAFVLCDAHVAADANTCAEFDLQTAGRGMPDYIIFSLDSVTSCTAGYQVIINGHTTTGGLAHAWATLNVTNSAAVVTTPVHRFIAGVTTDTGCATTGLTVNMVLYFRKD